VFVLATADTQWACFASQVSGLENGSRIAMTPGPGAVAAQARVSSQTPTGVLESLGFRIACLRGLLREVTAPKEREDMNFLKDTVTRLEHSLDGLQVIE
jgi:hypothetical protein